MADLVPTDEIEAIVGVKRHPTDHFAKAVSAEQKVYILHSQECFDSTPDLRDCDYSKALDRGIDPGGWIEDEPVSVMLFDGILCMEAEES